jgi:dihydrofolate reductase
MGKLLVYNFVTTNGYYKGPNEDVSWSHRGGKEENEYAEEGAQSEGVLIFGRVTYQMMAAYWPSPMALQNDPVIADGMNRSQKIVFSRTMKKADWNNTRIVKEDLIGEIKKLKQAGKNLTLLGSGSISAQLAQAGLIDEYQIMIHPVLLGGGSSLYHSLDHPVELQLTNSRIMKSGVVLLCYQPKR